MNYLVSVYIMLLLVLFVIKSLTSCCLPIELCYVIAKLARSGPIRFYMSYKLQGMHLVAQGL